MNRKLLLVALFLLTLFGAGTGLIQGASAGSITEGNLTVFTIGGIDVTGLPGLQVSDPINDPGAILEVADFSNLTGVTATIQPGVVIKNPYETVNWNNSQQYKANFHTHTTYSDGTKAPHERIDEYYYNGYKILSLTDHDNFNPQGPLLYPWTNLRGINAAWENRNPHKLDMVAVSGVEISNGIHIGSHFNDFVGEASSNEEYVLSQIQARNGLAQFYHPGMYTFNNPNNLVNWYADKYKKFDCLVGMEVYNGRDLYPRDRQFWDNVLMKTLPEKVVWAFGNDDNHFSFSYLDFLLSWNMFILDELSLEKVKDAYENGLFFACNKNSPNAPDPPTIKSIDLLKDTLTINATGYDSIVWIADGVVVGTEASIDLSKIKYLNKYVRAKLVKSDRLFQGRTLIQPFQFISQAGGAKMIVTINGYQVDEANLAKTEIAEGDEILVTVIAEDGTAMNHFKVTTASKTPSSLPPEEISGDDSNNIIDITLTIQFALDPNDFDEDGLFAEDADSDDNTELHTAALIMQYALNLFDLFK